MKGIDSFTGNEHFIAGIVFLSKYDIDQRFFGLSERCPNVFAVNKENPSDRINEHHPVTIRTTMAGISGKDGVKGRNSGGLNSDKGGDNQIGTAIRILAEVIATDASLLTVFR